jgi:hypothetical protein
MVNSMQGNVQEYKVHCDGINYRYDFSGDFTGVVIVKPEQNLTAILIVEEKMVHYTNTDGRMSHMNDPAQAYGGYLQYGTEKITENQDVNGYNCTKKVIYQGEKPLISLWFSEDLNFPVKMENHYSEGTYMHLDNIQYWKPNPSIFEVPDDFVEVDDEMRPIIPEPEPPTEWEEITISLPANIEIERGMLLKIKVDETVYHKMEVENTGDTPCKFIYKSFVDGIEQPEDVQGPEEYRTQRLYMGDDYKLTHSWKVGQEIHIYVYEGIGKLKIYKE